MARLLIVDDEVKLLRLLERLFREEGHRVSTATRAEDAERKLQQDDYDLLITDVRLPRRSGIELLGAARGLQPELQVVVMSAYGTVSGAVEAMRLGAFDYLLKPFELEGLRLIAERALQASRIERENRYLRSELAGGAGRGLVARSTAMRGVVDRVERAAPAASTVLILGESGVGKELVAETIHALSPRSERPLIRVNCPAIPRDLLESELFGHVRGAFTGAEASRPGKFELADGGTLFLDELGDLPPAQQGKLLNVLETRRFSRVGSGEEIEVDVRILAATNQDLEELVRQGRFRADLYYRLAVLPILVPPLRERREDLPGLLQELGARLAQRLGRPGLVVDSEAVIAAMGDYAWPGNVRELRNLLERAAVLSCEDTIRSLELPCLERPSPPATPPAPMPPAPPAGDGDLNRDVEAFKRARILEALEASGWVKKAAAEALGLSPRALSHYIQRYGLESKRGS
jgi:DNA-binding NtrC family response regulator